jgi:hypothetical protein
MNLRSHALFVSFFLEALKPNAVNILDAGCAIADSFVSASTRLDVQSSEPDTVQAKAQATTTVDIAT